MLSKIRVNAVVASLQQPTRGRANNNRELRRFLAPAASTTSRSDGCCYHSQTVPQQNPLAAADKPMTTMTTMTTTTTTIPPNLMFDLKSSFAPQRHAPAANEMALSLAQDDDDENDKETGVGVERESELGESTDDESEYEYTIDDSEIEDDALAFFATASNAATHRKVQPLPDRLQVSVHDGPTAAEEAVGTIWLDPTVFGVEDIRVDLIAQNVNYIRNKIRGFRKAKSKTISEKSGSGRKVRNQKGGGQARAGHSRPAHWRGGAKAHGPKNTKDYGNTKLNKRVRGLAMRSMLSQKLREGNLVVVNHLHLDSHRTGPWAKILESKYGVGKALKKSKLRNNNPGAVAPTTSALILDHYLEPEDKNEESDHASYHGVPINLWVASSNIPRATVRNHRFLNVYDCLKNEKLIITLSALEAIEEKWKE